MKILEKEFRKKGFSHKEVFRKGQYAIYERCRVTKGAKESHYELIIIKEHGAYEMGGVKFEAGEGYPADNSWGVLGWTLPTKDEAFAKLKIVKEHRESLDAAPIKRGRPKKK